MGRIPSRDCSYQARSRGYAEHRGRSDPRQLHPREQLEETTEPSPTDGFASTWHWTHVLRMSAPWAFGGRPGQSASWLRADQSGHRRSDGGIRQSFIRSSALITIAKRACRGFAAHPRAGSRDYRKASPIGFRLRKAMTSAYTEAARAR